MHDKTSEKSAPFKNEAIDEVHMRAFHDQAVKKLSVMQWKRYNFRLCRWQMTNGFESIYKTSPYFSNTQGNLRTHIDSGHFFLLSFVDEKCEGKKLRSNQN